MEIKSLLPSHHNCQIFLRTAPWTIYGSDLMHELNDIILSLGREMNIHVFDFNKIAWAKHNYSYDKHGVDSIFLDIIHPNREYQHMALNHFFEDW